MLGWPKAVEEEDLELPGPTLSCPMSEPQRGLTESKTRGGRFSDPPHFWLRKKGIILSTDCQAFPIPASGGYNIKDSGSRVRSHQSGMFWTPECFPFRPVPQGAAVVSPASRAVGYTAGQRMCLPRTLVKPCWLLFHTLKKHQDASFPGKTCLFGPQSSQVANQVGGVVLSDLPLGNR